jgi:hypothetical protein
VRQHLLAGYSLGKCATGPFGVNFQQRPNVLCALVKALADPERCEISERDGELFIVPRSDQS